MNREPIGVAVIGFGWMGQIHTRGYLRVQHHFSDIRRIPHLVAVADPAIARFDDLIDRYQFATRTTRWEDVIDDARVEAVSIATPNMLHREVAEAATAAGKHIWVEKPVGVTSDDARAVYAAAQHHQVASAVGFNYRHPPAVKLARQLIADGQLGTITNAHIRMTSDWAASPATGLSWRFERRWGGPGVIGDLGSHGVDLSRYLLGEVDSLLADSAIQVLRRPQPEALHAGAFQDAAGRLGDVENEDYFACLLRFSSGARGILEASRVSVGDQCTYGFEIHGTRGALIWDYRRMGELKASLGQDYKDQSYRTRLVTPADGDFGAFQPTAGNPMSFDDLKVIEAAQFLRYIEDGQPRGATAADAALAAGAIDCIVHSAATSTWVPVPGLSGTAQRPTTRTPTTEKESVS